MIQVLHPIGNDSGCTLFTRWGRVGENGQQQRKVSFTSHRMDHPYILTAIVKGFFPASMAVNEFKKQFKAKTATNWEQRHGMVAKKGELHPLH